MSIKTSFSNLCAVLKEMLDSKVDKVSGKGLSTNDFTTAHKAKLDGIATGANKITVDSALSTTSKNPVQNMVIAGQISTLSADLTDLKAWKTNITTTITDIQTDTATITKDEFTTMLS